MKAVLIAMMLVFVSGCSITPDSEAAQNGVLCYEGSFNAPWNANARANGVRLDADVDVTSVSPEEWIKLYEAFCRGNSDL